MENIMLDLETMSTTPNAAIISIGAVKFDMDLGLIERFYRVVDLESCKEKDFHIDDSTVKWWSKQSDIARKEVAGEGTTPAIPLKYALKQFRDWMGKGNVQIWGNGSDFDNVILANAFRKYGVNNAWDYRQNRCYRTMVASFPNIEMKMVGTYHKADDDAIYQAEYLMELVEVNKLLNVL